MTLPSTLPSNKTTQISLNYSLFYTFAFSHDPSVYDVQTQFPFCKHYHRVITLSLQRARHVCLQTCFFAGIYPISDMKCEIFTRCIYKGKKIKSTLFKSKIRCHVTNEGMFPHLSLTLSNICIRFI